MDEFVTGKVVVELSPLKNEGAIILVSSMKGAVKKKFAVIGYLNLKYIC